ncbi:MAG TPA: hypothetical protein VEH27_02530 [Methylomirabilota bacterium]|nr:hypothetical protein [Methylomirabilota bacterium]
MPTTIQGQAKFTMRRDILFLFTGLGEDRMFGDHNYFFATPDAKLCELFQEGGAHVPELRRFLEQSRDVRCFGVRTNEPSEMHAVAHGFRILSGMLDGIALAAESSVRVCPVVFAREKDSPDLHLQIFVDEGGWASIGLTASFEETWTKRRAAIYERVFKFADLVNGNKPASELTDQIRCSSKMYRHGGESRIFGLQFLAKFSAVEGLVCGPALFNHGHLLKTRISCLFRKIPEVCCTVSDLWNHRCSASHQARAFEQFGGEHLPALIPTLDLLFSGLFVFAVDLSPRVTTVKDLWGEAARYALPPELLVQHPPNSRFAVSRADRRTDFKVTNNGRIFDQFFRDIPEPIEVQHSRTEEEFKDAPVRETQER